MLLCRACVNRAVRQAYRHLNVTVCCVIEAPETCSEAAKSVHLNLIYNFVCTCNIPVWQANSCSAGQGIPAFCGTEILLSFSMQSLSFVLVLSHVDQIRILTVSLL